MTTVRTITCRTCGDEIYSRAPHDFRVCSCWNPDKYTGVAIDGGWSYTRVVGTPAASRTVEVDATRHELYQDWARGGNKFGKIRRKT